MGGTPRVEVLSAYLKTLRRIQRVVSKELGGVESHRLITSRGIVGTVALERIQYIFTDGVRGHVRQPL